ncbi:MAG: GIY-YIG nuclease family protein [Bacteroidota bacterium]
MLRPTVPRPGFVYLLASRPNGTLYIGVTSHLARRVWEHRNDLAEGFTRRYGVHRLVYFERYDNIRDAIEREKRLKKWRRAWKLRLVREANPAWEDLYAAVVDSAVPPEGMPGREVIMGSRLRGNDR